MGDILSLPTKHSGLGRRAPVLTLLSKVKAEMLAVSVDFVPWEVVTQVIRICPPLRATDQLIVRLFLRGWTVSITPDRVIGSFMAK